MVKLIRKLYRTRLLTLVGLFRLVEALLTTGVNPMALLRIAAKLHPQRTAVISDREHLPYPELWHRAETLAIALHTDYGIQRRQNVAIACRNHPATILAIFAVSRLGANVFLLNPEMSTDQMQALTQSLAITVYIYDGEDGPEADPRPPWLKQSPLADRALPAYHPTIPSIQRLSAASKPAAMHLKPVKAGAIVVMTGGTTGQPKPASRKPSLVTFLPPFIALLCQVDLDHYRSLYIATPIYHGFGLAALLMGVILGAELHVTPRFDAAQACAVIARYHIDVVTLVPLMLQRMLRHDPSSLSSLKRILTGGAVLSQILAQTVIERLGAIIFNLYGTSEAGFCLLGTPDVLRQKPTTIGQPVWGVQAAILNDSNQPVSLGETGRLCIRSAWTVSQTRWIETGDLACQDAAGDIFLRGRVDDMIVSGGENVYPIDLESILGQHPTIAAAAVVGISDPDFGQRLKAVVVRKDGLGLDEPTLRDWLKPRVARYQMPAIIEFRQELPYTSLGKLDKTSLSS